MNENKVYSKVHDNEISKYQGERKYAKKKKPSGENKGTKCRGKGLQEYGISLQKHWKLEDSRVIPSRY